MGLFPTDAVNGQQVTNTRGTVFEYNEAGNYWFIVFETDVYTQAQIDAHRTLQHNRDISPVLVIAQDAHTVGANNVYKQTAYVNHGTNSKTNSRASYWHFILPDDYVDGENLTIILHYIISSASATVNYQWLHQYYLDGEAIANASTPAGSYTSDSGANHLNIETSTITGTNLVGGTHMQIAIRIEDNAAAQIVRIIGMELQVPVNTRD